jgi:hypothetical protein
MVGKTEHSIRCKGEEVRSILAGRQTQMWLVIKPPPVGRSEWVVQTTTCSKDVPGQATYNQRHCPFRVGMTLWVRETWANVWNQDGCRFDGEPDAKCPCGGCHVEYRADTNNKYPGHWPDDMGDDPACSRWRPSIHMPRWAARIFLEVTAVRVVRVQDITIRDAVAAGLELGAMSLDGSRRLTDTRACPPDLLEDWVKLWDSINAKGGFCWNSNPWAWAVTFKMRKQEL